MVIVFGAFITACTTTTVPITYTDTFNVSSDHFREIRRGPWEVINDTQYRLILDHDEKIIDVRGRESIEGDMKKNFDFRIRKPEKDWFPGADGKIRIHSGFFRRYESVRNILLDAAYEYPDYAIHVSGFSLGGTWTQLFLLDVIQIWSDRDIRAIFYAPANPWRRLPKEYQNKLRQHTVFVKSHWDLFTWMRVIGFYRYGYNITIGKWWRFLPPQHEPPQMIRSLDEISAND
jgi:hypothetical protein